MNQFSEKDIIRLNAEEHEKRVDLPNLYQSMVLASQGDDYYLGLHTWDKWITGTYINENGKAKKWFDKKLVLVEPRLNKLLNDLKKEFCNKKDTYSFGIKQGHYSIGATATNAVFEDREIESMFRDYLQYFPYGVVYLIEDEIEVNVPTLDNFKGENDKHSNNKLIKYITDTFKKKVIIEVLNKRNDVVRRMVDGETYFVKQNDLDVVSFEDLQLSHRDDDEGNEDLTEVVETIADEQTHEYFAQKPMRFIQENYKNILSEQQLERFNLLAKAIDNKELELFKDQYQSQLNIEGIGKVLFPDKENNYRQPAVRSMLKSMHKKMEKALQKEGFNEVIIRSNYAPFPQLSPKENKIYKEYRIENKYIKKDYQINDLHNNVKFYKDEQVIPVSDIEKILNGELSVQDLIKNHNINKKQAQAQSSVVRTYYPVGVEEFNNLPVEERYIIEDFYFNRFFNTHCMGIVQAVRDGWVQFKQIGDEMIPSSGKLLSLTLDEYNIITSRNKLKAMEVVKVKHNPKYFNISRTNRLINKEFVLDNKKYKYIDEKNFNNLIVS